MACAQYNYFSETWTVRPKSLCSSSTSSDDDEIDGLPDETQESVPNLGPALLQNGSKCFLTLQDPQRRVVAHREDNSVSAYTFSEYVDQPDSSLATSQFDIFRVDEATVLIKQRGENMYLAWKDSNDENGDLVIRPAMVPVANVDVASKTENCLWRIRTILIGTNIGRMTFQLPLSNRFFLCASPNDEEQRLVIMSSDERGLDLDGSFAISTE